jgi:GAF domain-containing protein
MASHWTKTRSLPRDLEIFLSQLRDFSAALAATPDLKSLAKMILETMLQVLAVEKASLFLVNEEKGGCALIESVQPKTRSGSPPLLAKEDPLFQFMLKNEGLLVRDELVGPDASAGPAGLSERMSSLDAAVGVPLNSRGKLLGMVTVSEKTSGQAYTAEEKEWLSIFANLAATALENRRLAEELKRSKSHIQRADRLASLGTLTAALAHELRNPLVAIKTFTQLLPERFEDEEFRSHFLNIVSAEVDRISTLINELLEFARPSDPRMEAENINAILDSILFLVSTGTKKKHIDIVRSFSPNLPPVPIDR